jgi:hypothetical protein
MASTLRKFNTVCASESTARTFTFSRGYAPYYNERFRRYDSPLRPWRQFEHNEHTALSGPRGFSTFSALQICKADYDKLRLDQDALRAYLTRSSQAAKRYLDSNPEARQRRSETARLQHARLSATNKDYIAFRKLHSWVYTYTWIRETLPWKSHHPLIYDEPVKHYCNGCRATKRT